MRRALAAVAAGLLLTAAPAANAADPILPLSEVTSGMVGEARTVVRGTEIVTFPVTVIDVLRAGDGPGTAQIIVRASGPLMDQTGGVAQGMSGSPVYVTGADGVPRVMGAIAFGSGDETNRIVGVTPIEQMIDSSSGQRANALRRGASRRVVTVRTRAAARAREAREPGVIALHPLLRWSVAGVSRARLGGLASQLAPAGIQLTSIGPRTTRPVAPLVPGASMSAQLAGGDLAIGAIGTVTYVDGATVLGFGHPFLGAGRTRMLLGDGYVLQVIPAPITGSSYKLAEPGALVGMITGDRADGVTGQLGAVEGIPAEATATDVGRGTTSTVRTVIAPDERVLPLMAGVLQDEPAIRVRDGVAGGTLTLRVRIEARDLRRPIVYRNVYAAAGDVTSLSSGQVQRIMSVLVQNGVRSIDVSRIAIDQTIEPRVRAARIQGARIVPARVRAGGRATLLLRLAPWRAAPVTVRVPIRIPGDLDTGRARLVVVPKSEGGFDPFPADLSESLGASVPFGGRAPDVARAERVAARATGTRVSRLLAGLARITDDRNDAIRLLGPDDDADDPTAGVTIAVPYVIHGGRAGARIRVR